MEERVGAGWGVVGRRESEGGMEERVGWRHRGEWRWLVGRMGGQADVASFYKGNRAVWTVCVGRCGEAAQAVWVVTCMAQPKAHLVKF